jgi:hypothetical protein
MTVELHDGHSAGRPGDCGSPHDGRLKYLKLYVYRCGFSMGHRAIEAWLIAHAGLQIWLARMKRPT